jgi:hypothetical protein
VADRSAAQARGLPPPTLHRFSAHAVRSDTVVLPKSGTVLPVGAFDGQSAGGWEYPNVTGIRSAWSNAM